MELAMSAPSTNPKYLARRKSLRNSRALALSEQALEKGFIEMRDKVPMYHVLLRHFADLPTKDMHALETGTAASLFVQSKEFYERLSGHDLTGLIKIEDQQYRKWSRVRLDLAAQEFKVQVFRNSLNLPN